MRKISFLQIFYINVGNQNAPCKNLISQKENEVNWTLHVMIFFRKLKQLHCYSINGYTLSTKHVTFGECFVYVYRRQINNWHPTLTIRCNLTDITTLHITWIKSISTTKKLPKWKLGFMQQWRGVHSKEMVLRWFGRMQWWIRWRKLCWKVIWYAIHNEINNSNNIHTNIPK